jgi:hypothetical protein
MSSEQAENHVIGSGNRVRAQCWKCANRREIITVRGQSYVSRFQNIDPRPLSARASVHPRLCWGGGGGGDTLAGRRGGWGVNILNILEDERHRIALLQ